jgi:Protein kinase domain
MRLIEGRDLQAVLAEGPLEPARAVRIIEHVALALHAAHEVGLLHRDVKPSNILLDKNDFAYLIDFGIARAADETRLTKSGNTIGTFHYIAPERLGSRAEENARADIYSLACVLYECLAGAPPFEGDSMARLVVAHLSTPPPQPSITQPNLPAQLDQVIATGMAKDPDRRYATTVELADAARDAITVPIHPPRPEPAPQPFTEQAPRSATAPTVVGDAAPGASRTAFASAATQHRPGQLHRHQVPHVPPYPQHAAPAASAPAQLQELSSASRLMSRGEFACLLCGFALVGISVAFCLVPWRGAAVRGYPVAGSLSGLFVMGVIPGIVLLVLGRGRTHAGMTATGCALVALGVATGIVWTTARGLTAEVTGAQNVMAFVAFAFAVAGLLLVVIATRRAGASGRALANLCIVCGAAILLMALIDSLLPVSQFWGDSSVECSAYRPFETISPDATTYYRVVCEADQRHIRTLLYIGAATGFVLVATGIAARLSRRRPR